MKVFIADDSEHIRKSLIAMLSKIKEINIVGQAASTGEAISLIPKADPDVVLLDIRIPGGSGMDVLKEIKSYKPGLIFIMITNYPYPQYREKCKLLGADYFLDKSTEFDKIPVVLKQLMDRPLN